MEAQLKQPNHVVNSRNLLRNAENSRNLVRGVAKNDFNMIETHHKLYGWHFVICPKPIKMFAFFCPCDFILYYKQKMQHIGKGMESGNRQKKDRALR